MARAIRPLDIGSVCAKSCIKSRLMFNPEELCNTWNWPERIENESSIPQGLKPTSFCR